MKPENALEIEDVWKSFRTGAIRGQTFMRQLESRVARAFGKEDPNSLIVERHELTEGLTSRNCLFWALQGVSFEVKQGEVVALLGRNGAGKSTLMQIVSRITEADRGVVRVRGRVASLLGAGVGFNDEMTGRENVFLNGCIMGMHPDEVEEAMESIAAFAEIPQFLDTPVKRYSNGMRARLGISVVMHLRCDLMILDEVFATGDQLFRKKCIHRMSELALSGRTILVVTHMPTLIRRICKRGIYLNGGCIEYDGKLNQAIKLYMDED